MFSFSVDLPSCFQGGLVGYASGGGGPADGETNSQPGRGVKLSRGQWPWLAKANAASIAAGTGLKGSR